MSRDLIRSPAVPTFESYPERANVYLLTLDPMPTELYLTRETVKGRIREKRSFRFIPGAASMLPSPRNICTALQSTLLEALQSAGYTVREKFTLVVDTKVNYAPDKKSLRIYPAFRPRIMHFGDCYWLCLDHRLIVRSVMSLAFLERLHTTFSLDASQRVIFRSRDGDGWEEGKWIQAGSEECHLALPTGEEVKVARQDIVPYLTKIQIAQIASLFGVNAQQLERTVKQLSFLTVANVPPGKTRCLHGVR